MLKWILLVALTNAPMCFGNGNETSTSYSKVRTLGSRYQGEIREHSESPRIYKLLSPMFNLSNPLIVTTEETLHAGASNSFSGRAYSSFPMRSYIGTAKEQSVSSRYQRPPNFRPRYNPYYPYAMERYTPGEAVASAQFKKNKDPYKYNPPRMKPTKTTENEYTPPKDLYSFPPNIDSNYLPPNGANKAKHKKPITSYIPPPAGVPDIGFVGPISPDYLPPSAQHPQTDVYLDKPPSEDVMSSDSADDMLPPLTNGDLQLSSKDPSSDKDPDSDGNTSEKMKEPDENDMLPNIDFMNMQMETPNAKPSMVDDTSSDVAVPNEMFMYHNDHAPYGTHGVDAYPEIIYDDHDHNHDHEHHHVHHVPPEMMTTTTMQPEPPPEPRVKKYSYFYLGRKLWYIPLYFTVWFSFYIFWLIVKSIARHKVNLPNHYTGRMMKRHVISTPQFEDQNNDLNELTVTVLKYINNFQLNHGKCAKR